VRIFLYLNGFGAADGTLRARPHCRSAPPRIHFAPDSLRDLVPPFSERQRDRTLGALQLVPRSHAERARVHHVSDGPPTGAVLPPAQQACRGGWLRGIERDRPRSICAAAFEAEWLRPRGLAAVSVAPAPAGSVAVVQTWLA
jgi:hypothetical protein